MLCVHVPGVFVTGKLLNGGSVGEWAVLAGRDATAFSCGRGRALWSLWTSLAILLASELWLGCTIDWLFGGSVATCQDQHKSNTLSSSVKTVCTFATCRPQFVPYQRGLRGSPAVALLLQTSYKLVLGAQHGGEGCIFLLQLPVVTGNLQRLTCHTDHSTADIRMSVMAMIRCRWCSVLCSPVL